MMILSWSHFGFVGPVMDFVAGILLVFGFGYCSSTVFFTTGFASMIFDSVGTRDVAEHIFTLKG
jgi:riboflavin transporter FmnP